MATGGWARRLAAGHGDRRLCRRPAVGQATGGWAGDRRLGTAAGGWAGDRRLGTAACELPGRGYKPAASRKGACSRVQVAEWGSACGRGEEGTER